MASLAEVLQEIDTKGQEYTKAAQNAGEISKQQQTLLDGVKKRIKAGESTGDPILDFVIIKYNYDRQIEQTFRALDQRVKANQGEFILIVTRRKARHVFRGPGDEPRSSDYHVQESLCLAVLRGDSLIIEPVELHCAFPTQIYACCHDTLREDVKLEEKDLTDSIFADFSTLGKKLDFQDRFAQDFQDGQPTALEIMIGDTEVNAWFDKRQKRYARVYQKMAVLVVRSIPKETKTHEVLQPLREGLLTQLKELISKRNILRQEIRRVEDAQRVGVYSPDGKSSIPCKTKSDVAKIQEPLRAQLKRVEDTIRNSISQGRDLGLQDDEFFSQVAREYEEQKVKV